MVKIQKLSTSVVYIEIFNYKTANYTNFLPQFVHTKAFAALTQFCDFWTHCDGKRTPELLTKDAW